MHTHTTQHNLLLQPVVADINAYSNIVEQAKMAGEALKGGADVNQGIRIEEKLAAILTQFSHLGAAAKIRMDELEDAKKNAGAYESQSSLLEKWLASMEGKLSEMGPLTVASQPLGRQEQGMKVCWDVVWIGSKEIRYM